MPVKIARSAPRPSFGLPELLVAIHTSRQSCSKAGKGRIFALVCESSGESRLNGESPHLLSGSQIGSRSTAIGGAPEGETTIEEGVFGRPTGRRAIKSYRS